MKSDADFGIDMASNKKWPLLAFILFAIYLFFSTLIPPFQSPDEYDHIKRAYLLVEGHIVLDSPMGQSSGGMIDVGLISYINYYKKLIGKLDGKLSADQIGEANSILWTGQREFSSAPGTGYYLPIVYLPQAVGLKVGEMLGASVDVSYRLARFSALLMASVFLFIAFRLYSPPPLVLALLLIPMSLFQMASASLDVISTGLAVLAISIFMRVTKEGRKTGPELLYGLAICVFLLASSRVHLLPMIGLLFATSFYTNSKKGLILGAVVLFGVLAWLVLAVKTTVDMRVVTGFTTSGIVKFYLLHPFSFFEVLSTTIPMFGMFYVNSFLGVLGWLDTPLSTEVYSRLCVLLFCVLICSISFKRLRTEWTARALLAVCALISTLFVFFALLVTWNAHPATVIQGVQGRYFLISALLFAYALGGGENINRSLLSVAGITGVGLIFLVSTYSTAFALLDRYYVVSSQPVATKTEMLVSPSLMIDKSIKLRFSQKHLDDSLALKRIGVMFATYVRQNPGEAELRLSTVDGAVFSQRFVLSDLADNQYRYFDLDRKRYTLGEIISVGGSGVSVWEGRVLSADANTCIIYEYLDGRRISTLGCPQQ
ncbi:DUF2142 domain-containing protein [Pseudomonas sp. URMO17WK12:I12]|uniref:DUF2142 domain-containing protein n=1 Tax=Pseudomonas sp. URMO17WK12:I12 TaxID=1259797 RepID=UPI0012DEB339|nr:DUF2142 domain-containing protein [Pseudomonas sp. URMO17WK12:I12]